MENQDTQTNNQSLSNNPGITDNHLTNNQSHAIIRLIHLPTLFMGIVLGAVGLSVLQRFIQVNTPKPQTNIPTLHTPLLTPSPSTPSSAAKISIAAPTPKPNEKLKGAILFLQRNI